MKKEKRCLECGKLFEAIKVNQQKYCSAKCRKKAEYERNADRYKQNSRKWYLENIEKAKKTRKKYAELHAEQISKRTKKWKQNNWERIKIREAIYKDKRRHGSLKSKLIKQNGSKCSMCGKVGDTFQIVAHHVTMNPQEHEKQILLCRSCHAKVHTLKRAKEKHQKVCDFCGKEFEGHYNAKYCSHTCKRRAEYQRDKDKIKKRVRDWKRKKRNAACTATKSLGWDMQVSHH